MWRWSFSFDCLERKMSPQATLGKMMLLCGCEHSVPRRLMNMCVYLAFERSIEWQKMLVRNPHPESQRL